MDLYYFFLFFDFSVRPDTLTDMVTHMTKSVGLVHQMPFACDRTGLPATLEKVNIRIINVILFTFNSLHVYVKKECFFGEEKSSALDLS